MASVGRPNPCRSLSPPFALGIIRDVERDVRLTLVFACFVVTSARISLETGSHKETNQWLQPLRLNLAYSPVRAVEK